MESLPSICFFSAWGYGALSRDRRIPQIGGAEVQQSFLARELVRRGHRVSMVTMDFGQPDRQLIDGVTVFKSHGVDAGLPGLRFLYPRLTSTWRALKAADADVYYQRGAGAATGIAAIFCRRHKRQLLFAAACDLDFDAGLPLVTNARDRAICRFGLRHADAIVVQSERQRQACADTLGRPSVVAPSCFEFSGAAADHSGPVLWVANVKPLKRPELLLEVAARLPGRRFVMVGGDAGVRGYFDAIRARAQALGNVEVLGHVPFADIEARFDGAAIFVNTSEFEGFPNTFLQSWARGIPTVSFFDPQVRFHGEPVACVASDVDDMARKIDGLLGAPVRWQAQGQLVRDYFQSRHSVARAVDQYQEVLATLGAPPLATRAA